MKFHCPTHGCTLQVEPCCLKAKEVFHGIVTVTDRLGNDHKVIAVKPESVNPLDDHLLSVLHESNSGLSPYVIHRMNLIDGGFFYGRYFNDLRDALKSFNEDI